MRTIFLSAARAAGRMSAAPSNRSRSGSRFMASWRLLGRRPPESCRRCVELLERFDADVFELHLHRRTGVELQREDAGLGGLGFLLVDHIDGRFAVDEMLEVIAFGDDDVIVPVILVDGGLDFLRVAQRADDLDFGLAVRCLDDRLLAALREDAAPALSLLVENAGISGADFEIVMITVVDDVAFVLAAILHAGIAPVAAELVV